jgi:hypothetical protein
MHAGRHVKFPLTFDPFLTTIDFIDKLRLNPLNIKFHEDALSPYQADSYVQTWRRTNRI